MQCRITHKYVPYWEYILFICGCNNVPWFWCNRIDVILNKISFWDNDKKQTWRVKNYALPKNVIFPFAIPEPVIIYIWCIAYRTTRWNKKKLCLTEHFYHFYQVKKCIQIFNHVMRILNMIIDYSRRSTLLSLVALLKIF